MHDVQKFFVCVFLGLVIFTPTCFAAMTCDEQVKFSATFKWNDGRVSMITSNIDRQIADDTEVYNAARARIDVLAGAFTKPLSQGRRFEACNVSETCEAGKTLQDCSPALARCFAEIVAQDEYIANLQNRLCNSGITLNKQNDQFRDLLDSYTPLRVPTSSNSSSAGGPHVTGSGESASVVEAIKSVAEASNRPLELRNTIIDQTKSMKLGMSFVYSASDMKNINPQMSDWDSACKKVKKPTKADTTGFKNVKEGNTIKHICVIKTCKGNRAPSADGLSCVSAESGGATTPASSSGGGSTPAPASTTPARSNSEDLGDVNQMITNQINESAGRGNVSRDGSDVSGGRNIGAIITEINTASKNMRIGTAAFSYPESMVSTGGIQLQTSIVNWMARCTEYPKTHDSSAINKTKPEKTTENGTIRHTCVIESCHEFYTQSSDGSTCERAQSQPIERMQNRPAAMIPSLGDERGDFIKNQTREVQLGRKLSFTAEDKTKYSNDLQSWRAACVSYATINISTDIAKTYIKETSDKKQTKFEWTCLIEKCQDQQNLSGKVKKMEPTPDGRGCMETNGKSCIPSDKHAEFGQFNEEKNICEVRTCKEDYTLTPDGKCEKTKKLERQAAKATTRLEKDFVSDINKLSDAFDKVVKKLTKECEKSGGTIKNGVCENAQTTEPAADSKTQASTNKRGSGRSGRSKNTSTN